MVVFEILMNGMHVQQHAALQSVRLILLLAQRAT